MDRDIILKIKIKEPSKKTVGKCNINWFNRKKIKPRIWVTKETLKFIK